jgi:hypothetical protein
MSEFYDGPTRYGCPILKIGHEFMPVVSRAFSGTKLTIEIESEANWSEQSASDAVLKIVGATNQAKPE